MITSLGTLVVVACVLTGYASMKAHGAKRFGTGLVLLPRLLLRAVILAGRATVFALSLAAAAAMAAPEAIGDWLEGWRRGEPPRTTGVGKRPGG